MNKNKKVFIEAMGMVTPIGLNTEMTSTSARAAISASQETEFYDEDFNKIRMAVVPSELLEDCLEEQHLMGGMMARYARMLQLSKIAMQQIIEYIPSGQKLPVFIAGPACLNNDEQLIDSKFINILQEQCDIEFDLDLCRIISTGRSGGIEVIDTAVKYLMANDNEFAIVGGVDSYYEKDVLDYYIRNQRLMTYSSTDGFIPGEGAAFLILRKASVKDNNRTLPYIIEPGTGYEEGFITSDEPYRGEGLAAAVTSSIRAAEVENIATIYSSLNGENYFSKELGVAIIRNKQSFSENYKMEHPADCFGDLGAAIGPVMIGLASFDMMNGSRKSPSLVYCSSDGGYRSAVVVSI